MKGNFARLLDTVPHVNDFLTITLNLNIATFVPLKKKPASFDINSSIVLCEKGVLDGIEHPTKTSKNFRDILYASDIAREGLQLQIVNELFTKSLLKNDEKIVLGKGGAMPVKPIKKKKAFILIGLPASGKSKVATQISNKFGAVILDSDFAKRKLPEYIQYPWGASLVNSESSKIIFGTPEGKFLSLYERVVDAKYNVVIPKVGAEPEDIIPYCENLNLLGYEVHLTLVYLPKEKSTIRALSRYIDTNRYVPLTLIFDVFGDNPALTYFKLKNNKPSFISSFGIINTDVPRNGDFICSDFLGNNPARIYSLKKNVLI